MASWLGRAFLQTDALGDDGVEEPVHEDLLISLQMSLQQKSAVVCDQAGGSELGVRPAIFCTVSGVIGPEAK
jgi:hypothetical protein